MERRNLRDSRTGEVTRLSKTETAEHYAEQAYGVAAVGVDPGPWVVRIPGYQRPRYFTFQSERFFLHALARKWVVKVDGEWWLTFSGAAAVMATVAS